MIRVNLLGSGKKGGKRSGGSRLHLPQIPNVGILLFVLLLVAEGAGLYLWQINAAAQANKAEQQLKRVKLDVASLTKVRDEITALKDEVEKLDKQKKLFEEFTADKTGPDGALEYLAFILEPREEKLQDNDVLKVMEAAGWRVGWDSRRAWFNSFREMPNGDVELTGEAMGHEDVAELMRRLEASPYFRDPRLMFQERKKDDRLDLTYVEFKIKATLVYWITPYNVAKPEDEAAAAAAGADASSSDGNGADGSGDASRSDASNGEGVSSDSSSGHASAIMDLDAASAGDASVSDAATGHADASDAQADSADGRASAQDASDAGAKDAAAKDSSGPILPKPVEKKPEEPPSKDRSPLPSTPPQDAPSAPAGSDAPAAATDNPAPAQEKE